MLRDAIAILDAAILAICFSFGILNWKKTNGVSKLITIILGLTFTTSFLIVSKILEPGYWRIKDCVYTAVVFTFYYILFYKILRTQINRRIVVLLGIASSIFAFAFIFDGATFGSWLSKMLSVITLCICLFSLLGFYELIKSPGNVALGSNPSFWLFCSVLSYWSLFILFFGFIPKFNSQNSSNLRGFLYFHIAFDILYYLSLARIIAFSKNENKLST